MKAGVGYVGVTTPFYCNDGNGNFLLQKRSVQCRDESGTWDPGAGELEFGTSLTESVLREVFEEYGCQGEIQEVLPAHDIFREHGGTKTHWVVLPFFIKVNPDDVKNNEPGKIEELGWFRLDSLPEPLHEGFRASFIKYQDYFIKYRH